MKFNRSRTDVLNAAGTPGIAGSADKQTAMKQGERYLSLLHTALLVLTVLALRSLLIGQPPFTDDGNYIATAFHLWNHPAQVIPSLCPVSSINLYSGMFSWIFGFCSDGFVAFRIVDALITALCTAVFYNLLKELSRSPTVAFFLTLVWVLCVNHPVFINAGFKNSYAPAFTCIFYALILLVRNPLGPPAFHIGALLGFAFLFREPLLVFAIPFAVHLFAGHSIKLLFRMAGGLCLTITAGFLALGLLRGGDVIANARNIIAAWTDIADMHETLLILGHYDRGLHVLAQLRSTIDTVGWAIPVWLTGMGTASFAFFRSKQNKHLLLLAALTAISPVPEFILKLGFPYHLSACFAGLSMLSAIGFGVISRQHRTTARQAYFPTLLVAVLIFPSTSGGIASVGWAINFRESLRLSSAFLPVMAFGTNAPDKEADSFYLRTKASIQHHSKPGDTIMVSGFYGALYPLSGRLPPRLEITDLTTYAFARHLVLTTKEREDLNRFPPTLFIESNRFSDFDPKTLFDDFPRHYALIDTIPPGPWHYGNFACKIYRRIE